MAQNDNKNKNDKINDLELKNAALDTDLQKA